MPGLFCACNVALRTLTRRHLMPESGAVPDFQKLTPAHGQMPAQIPLRRLAKYTLVFMKLLEHRQRLGAEGSGKLDQKIHQHAYREQTFRGLKPLRLR